MRILMISLYAILGPDMQLSNTLKKNIEGLENIKKDLYCIYPERSNSVCHAGLIKLIKSNRTWAADPLFYMCYFSH